MSTVGGAMPVEPLGDDGDMFDVSGPPPFAGGDAGEGEGGEEYDDAPDEGEYEYVFVDLSDYARLQNIVPSRAPRIGQFLSRVGDGTVKATASLDRATGVVELELEEERITGGADGAAGEAFSAEVAADPERLCFKGQLASVDGSVVCVEDRVQVSSVDEEPLSFVCTRSARMERAFFDARGEDITAPVLQHVRNEIDAALTKK
jgi:hypothetical protein